MSSGVPPIPYAPARVYDPSNYSMRIADLIMRRGDVLARGQAASGQIWGNAINQIGQIAAGAYQQHQQDQDKQKKAQAVNQIMTSWDGQDPQQLFKSLAPVIGPEPAIKVASGMSSLMAAHQKAEPDVKDLAATAGGLAALERSMPGYIQNHWQMVGPAIAPLAQRFGMPIGQEYHPDYTKGVLALDQQFNGPKAQSKPDTITVQQPDGTSKVMQWAGEQGKWVEAPGMPTIAAKPEKPEKLSGEDAFIRARFGDNPTASQLLLGRAQYAAAGREPKTADALTAGGLGNFQLTGEDFLKTVPPELQGTIRKIANYQEDITKVSSIRGDQRQKLAAMVTQYDPTFDMSQYQSRQRLRTDFTSGMAAKNLTALNTAERHIETLETAGKSLAQNDTPLLNKMQNFAAKETGSSSVTGWENARSKVADEVNRAFVGAGQQAQAGIQRELDSLDPNMSPAQRAKAIATVREMLAGRREELKNQYERGMGKPFDLGPSITQIPGSSGPKIGKYRVIGVE